MAPAPRATRQAQLEWAKGLCDAAMDAASRRGVQVAVAVVDRGGDPIQQDLMDGGPAGAVAVAQAVAGAAALFDCDSGDLGARFGPAEPSRRWWCRQSSAYPAACRSATRVRGGRPGRRRRRTVRLPGDRAHRPGRGVTGGAAGPVRVAVIGCGAIGSLYAAHLARVPGVEVWAVDPWAEHVDAMEARGLRVTGLADFTAPVHARTDGGELPACHFGARRHQGAAHPRGRAGRASRPWPDAAVVSLQNGLGNEEVIAEFVPRVIRGSIVTAGAIVAPGVVRYDAPGDSWFGPFEPRPAPMNEVGQLARLLTEGGLRTHALKDARGPQWTKVIFNSATSPLAALTGLPVGRVCTDARASPAGRRAGRGGGGGLRTGRDRAHAPAGRGRGRGHRRGVRAQAEHAPGRPRAPGDRDRRAQRRHRRRGRRVGVPTPLHDCMVALVKGLERSWRSSEAGLPLAAARPGGVANS